jgi:hypothetical protein
VIIAHDLDTPGVVGTVPLAARAVVVGRVRVKASAAVVAIARTTSAAARPVLEPDNPRAARRAHVVLAANPTDPRGVPMPAGQRDETAFGDTTPRHFDGEFAGVIAAHLDGGHILSRPATVAALYVGRRSARVREDEQNGNKNSLHRPTLGPLELCVYGQRPSRSGPRQRGHDSARLAPARRLPGRGGSATLRIKRPHPGPDRCDAATATRVASLRQAGRCDRCRQLRRARIAGRPPLCTSVRTRNEIPSSASVPFGWRLASPSTTFGRVTAVGHPLGSRGAQQLSEAQVGRRMIPR